MDKSFACEAEHQIADACNVPLRIAANYVIGDGKGTYLQDEIADWMRENVHTRWTFWMDEDVIDMGDIERRNAGRALFNIAFASAKDAIFFKLRWVEGS